MYLIENKLIFEQYVNSANNREKAKDMLDQYYDAASSGQYGGPLLEKEPVVVRMCKEILQEVVNQNLQLEFWKQYIEPFDPNSDSIHSLEYITVDEMHWVADNLTLGDLTTNQNIFAYFTDNDTDNDTVCLQTFEDYPRESDNNYDDDIDWDEFGAKCIDRKVVPIKQAPDSVYKFAMTMYF